MNRKCAAKFGARPTGEGDITRVGMKPSRKPETQK